MALNKFEGYDMASTHYSYLNSNIVNTTERNIKYLARIINQDVTSKNEISISRYQAAEACFRELIELNSVNPRITAEKDNILMNLENILSDLPTDLANKIWYNRNETSLESEEVREILSVLEDAPHETYKAEIRKEKRFVKQLHDALDALENSFYEGNSYDQIVTAFNNLSKLEFNDKKYQDIYEREFFAYIMGLPNLMALSQVLENNNDKKEYIQDNKEVENLEEVQDNKEVENSEEVQDNKEVENSEEVQDNKEVENPEDIQDNKELENLEEIQDDEDIENISDKNRKNTYRFTLYGLGELVTEVFGKPFARITRKVKSIYYKNYINFLKEDLELGYNEKDTKDIQEEIAYYENKLAEKDIVDGYKLYKARNVLSEIKPKLYNGTPLSESEQKDYELATTRLTEALQSGLVKKIKDRTIYDSKIRVTTMLDQYAELLSNGIITDALIQDINNALPRSRGVLSENEYRAYLELFEHIIDYRSENNITYEYYKYVSEDEKEFEVNSIANYYDSEEYAKTGESYYVKRK